MRLVLATCILLATSCAKPIVDSAAPAVDDDGDGYAQDSDCDDQDPGVHPDAQERCNGEDDDCDGVTDEDAIDAPSWYPDQDGDGFGDSEQPATSCEAMEGYVETDGDCDDSDAAIHPSATETCNDADDDCDGEVDEDLGESWWGDADGDGWGDPGAEFVACDQPADAADNAEDCDDGDPGIHPDAAEICDGVDQDCDGEVDEDVMSWFWVDDDGDGYGDASTTVQACEPGEGVVDDDQDCDDSDPWVNPGVITDDCNATDDDCDGSVDEDVKAGWILVTVDGGDEAIYQIDTTTAAMTTLAALDDPGLGNVNTMDVSEDGVAIIHSVDTGQLVEIDVCTGTTAAIGSTNVGNTNGIAFDADHTLYGIDTDNDELVWYDTLTGNGTVIGSLGFGLGNGGLAYDCATDTLYGVDGSSNDIFVLDRATGLASGFIGTSVPFSAVGIEFDHTSRTLFASTGSALYQIDPASGASTYIGAVSTAEAVNDLAFHPSCP